jgi:Fe-S-cluster-containing dehydrogenase component
MAKKFVIDIRKCQGCYNCQVACKDEHCGNDWTPYAKSQPESGQFWGKLKEVVRGTRPQMKLSYVFEPCQHCVDAPCIEACTTGAIYQRDDGLVIIDPAKCLGLKHCIEACPYGVIYFNQELTIAQKCTGCEHLLDRGWPIKEPWCADVCTCQAIDFGEESELDLSGTETLYPEYGLTTRVAYKHLPKRFIAGTVYDPVDKEVVIGATCTLNGDNVATTTTDIFGDFWFEDLPVGTYSLKIEADGFTSYTKEISTEKDVSLGNIALSK